MKKSLSLLLISVTSALIISCSPSAPDAEKVSESDYPLKTCVVSGEPLGSMGKPYVLNHNGTEVRLCCKSCLKDFNADPEKYLSMIK